MMSHSQWPNCKLNCRLYHLASQLSTIEWMKTCFEQRCEILSEIKCLLNIKYTLLSVAKPIDGKINVCGHEKIVKELNY